MNIIVVIIKPSLNFWMIVYSLHKYSYFISSSVKNSTSLYHASYHYPFTIFNRIISNAMYAKMVCQQKKNNSNTISLKWGLAVKKKP